MEKYLISGLFAFLFTITSLAQDFRGKVLDQENDNALADVVVTNLNSGKNTVTDASGVFRFKAVDFPLKLEFSILGYQKFILSFQDTKDEVLIFLKPEIGQLSEVVLRSTNIPQKIINIPAAVSLISENDLNRKDNFNLLQTINYMPGVYVNQGALNTNKINIRGIGSRAQYSTNRIKAYINGIPLTTAEGELTLDDFDPELLDRVEIFKGPVSSVFGAGLGGAINLYTRKDRQDEKSVTGEFNYGSFNTRKSRVNISYIQDSLDLSFNYNNISSDGYRQNGNYDRISLTGTAGLLDKRGNYWSLFYSYTNLKAYIPSSLNENDFNNNPNKAAYTWYQSAGYESYSRNILGLSYKHHFSENLENRTAVFYNSRDGYEPRPFDILDDMRESLGVRTRFNYETSFFELPSEISFGGEGMLENYETGTFQNLYKTAETRRSILGDRLSMSEQDRNYINVFAQMNVDLTSKLIVEAGINFNTTSYKLTDKFPDDELDQSGDYSFDPVLSPRLGLSYKAFQDKTFYASVSHGFSTPTVAETLTPEGLINTELKTETGWNYEVGFKGNWLNRKLYTELNLYTIKIRNLLVARRVGEDQYVGVNAGKSSHNGIEFTSSYRNKLTDKLSLNWFLNSNINFFEFDKFVDLGENYSGNEIPGTPKYMVSPGVDATYNNLKVNLNYQAFGEMALNDSNSVYTDPYQLLNFKLNYNWQLSSQFDLVFNFGINNIWDEHYAASVVTNAIGFGGSAPRYYYPGNPRNFYGGARLKFNL